MTRITVLPGEACPKGAVFEAEPGQTLCQAMLERGIDIDHACDMSCACTTCHVVVREGFASLTPADEYEEDLLDRAWGLEATSRLSCQVKLANTDLVVEIPRYSINQKQ